MKIIERGHVYELQCYDGEDRQTLTFVNREPNNEHSGTQTQEVLRALIDRTRHCDNCARWVGNDAIIYHLRMALVLHEVRALMRHTQRGDRVELVVINEHDGHFALANTTVDPQAAEYNPHNRMLSVEPRCAEWQTY